MLQTVTGPVYEHSAGRILVHEHILVGFIEDGKLTRQDYEEQDVIDNILPLLMKLKQSGCATFVDCSPEYLGRDPFLLKRLSLESGLFIVTNTGLYKSPYLPPYAYEESERQLADRWINEAHNGIEGSGVFPGFIKIAINDGPRIDETQQKILRAAIRTSLETGLPIQCHTVGGDAALHANEIMQLAGFDRERFIWVHAQTCIDMTVRRRLADEGMWISIDSILPGTYDKHIELLTQLRENGAGERILLSQDTGWYNVGQPNGGKINSYHHLLTDFLPYARQTGLDAQWLEQCITRHPYQAMRLRMD